jgi:DNA polymerase III subunit alpha
MSWVPLHVHSQYSILDALAPIDAIAKRAAEFGMPAVALTDHGNLYGAVEFYRACQDVGVKPLIGCEVYVAPGDRKERARSANGKTAYHLVLIAKNQIGYRNLCHLSSRGFTEGFYYHPRVDKELLEQYAEGLVCLSGCLSGSVPYLAVEGGDETLIEEIEWHRRLFKDDYYLEIQRHIMSDLSIESDGFFQESWLLQQYESFRERQDRVNRRLVDLSKELSIPIVATNDSHYMDRDDWRAHEVLLNIQSGEPCEIWETDSRGQAKFRVPNPKRRVYPTHECYFKSPDEMQALFADLPEAISNTCLIAEKCDLQLDFKTKHYPVFVAPHLEGGSYSEEERASAAEAFLRQLCEEGMDKRYTAAHLEQLKAQFPDREARDLVHERLELEMSVIIPKGMCDYLLIVWDFINWAKSRGIPVGPGRGSGAGSIILYLIGVTDVEPLRFGLFFERFINPERLSYPDIDVDICMERRSEVIDYTVQKYGKECVAQIITFGTMKAKMVVRDVGRVLSVPLKEVDALAKLIPDDLGMTLERALDLDPDLHRLYSSNQDAKRVIDLGMRLEGAIRSTGTHAAGVIISGRPLTENIPICTAKDSEMVVTQYSMKPVEQVGMLKMDMLGLKTLSCIRMATAAVQERYGVHIDPLELPLNDSKTFDLLNQGKTLGIFQMESGGMQELARQLHVDRFEEVIAVGALYRPGPMDMIPSFVARKHGREPIAYDHPWLREILDETYGIMVYQEQVMQIAQKLASYSLGEGDILRKAMGKKGLAEMATQREKFIQGSVKNGVPEEVAVLIFDHMEKFASYGFNKSHATCYGLLTYITAYLKSNYAAEWMAALMTCDRDDTTKLARWIHECHAMGLQILPPDVNEAGDCFVATAGGVRFAISGIKGVGRGVVEAIIEERTARGAFTGLYNFLERVDTRRIGKKQVELLVEAGCFDSTGWLRDAMRESIEPMYERTVRQQKEERAGVMSLFSLIEEDKGGQFQEPPQVVQPTSRVHQLSREKELLGFYLTGHPMDSYRPILERLSCIRFAALEQLDHQAIVRTSFIIDSVAIRIASKSQRKFAILSVSDGLDSYELPIWSDLFDEKSHLLREGQMVYAVVEIDRRDGGLRLQCRWFDDLTLVDEKLIEECDRAFDRAKMMNTRRQFSATKSEGESVQQGKKEEPQTIRQLKISLDVNQLRLSHLLELKEAFREVSGRDKVLLQFLNGESVVGSVAIDSEWGVSAGEPLAGKLQGLSSILRVEVS